jgi:CRP-like cAMP-binding protein
MCSLENTTTSINPAAERNRLLAELRDIERQRVFQQLECVFLEEGQVLHDGGEDERHAHFPINCIISLIYLMEGGSSTEVAVVGREGMTGTSLIMGHATNPTHAVVTRAGEAYRMKGFSLRREFDRSETIQQILLRYTQVLLTQLAQTAVCNRHHSVEQQLCRWLLMNLDRLPGNTMSVTQEPIAQILGLRRESINEALFRLESAGIIGRKQDQISVLDRSRLEERSCHCYGVVLSEFEREFPEPAGAC